MIDTTTGWKFKAYLPKLVSADGMQPLEEQARDNLKDVLSSARMDIQAILFKA
ncbi:MAG: hypothetical protein O7F15_04755 [Gammaproteobacteria bacterium]|nr:hypothetical protein [Gammaproteobacteria bacterium]